MPTTACWMRNLGAKWDCSWGLRSHTNNTGRSACPVPAVSLGRAKGPNKPAHQPGTTDQITGGGKPPNKWGKVVQRWHHTEWTRLGLRPRLPCGTTSCVTVCISTAKPSASSHAAKRHGGMRQPEQPDSGTAGAYRHQRWPPQPHVDQRQRGGRAPARQGLPPPQLHSATDTTTSHDSHTHEAEDTRSHVPCAMGVADGAADRSVSKPDTIMPGGAVYTALAPDTQETHSTHRRQLTQGSPQGLRGAHKASPHLQRWGCACGRPGKAGFPAPAPAAPRFPAEALPTHGWQRRLQGPPSNAQRMTTRRAPSSLTTRGARTA